MTNDRADLLRMTARRLRLFLRLEWKILAIIFAYAVAIGLFSLIVPLTVQELVSTFSFAVQPVMIVTLASVMLAMLLVIAAFRVLQARAVEILIQRLYARISLSFTEAMFRLDEEHFLPHHANYFLEAELMPRALLALLADLLNVTVVGSIGMTMLVLYHPYFVLYNAVLLTGFAVLLTLLGRGGLLITLDVSHCHYRLFNWLQNIAHNLPHLKAAASGPLLMGKTDELARAYVMTRKTRSDILTGRQYKGAAIWQAFGHSGLVAMAGWLVAAGELTVGQFAAAEVVVGNLLINMDILARRMYALYYVFASFEEMAGLLSLPKKLETGRWTASKDELEQQGVRIAGKDLAFGEPGGPPLFSGVNLDVMPGEKVAILTGTSTSKTALAQVLAGLYVPTAGVVRYNDVDLRLWSRESLNACRGLVLDSHPSLLDGTLEENVSLGRPEVSYHDVRWALRFAELDEEVDALPMGLRTPVTGHGRTFTVSQILRLLVARAIVIRPQVLIFDGTLHSMLPAKQETILRRLCAKEEPWSVIFVSNDPVLLPMVDRRILLD
ncbi:MAG: ABC transporter ATP-binding protein [Nitrospirota bacterium]